MQRLKTIICLLTAVSVLFAGTNVRLELDYNYSSSPTILLAENTDDSDFDEDEFWEQFMKDGKSDVYRRIPPGGDFFYAYLGGGLTYAGSKAIAFYCWLINADAGADLAYIFHIISPVLGSIILLHIFDPQIPTDKMIPGAILGSIAGGAMGLIIDDITNPTETSDDQGFFVFALGSLILAPLGAVIGYRQTAPLQPEKSVSVHPPSFEFTNTTYPDGSVELSSKLVLVDIRF